MIVFATIFLLYLIVLIFIGSLLVKAWRWLSRRCTHGSATVMAGEVTRQGGWEILETAGDNSYPSPCLSCTRKIDPVLCAGCTEIRR